jgi:hypothetical protein
MAFNGTGTFNRIYNWVTDKTNSVPITASRMDAEMDGMATGLSTCITKDGQTTITANIPMNSKKFTGLTTGNARTDSISLGQVQDGQFTYLGTSGGSADAYTLSPTPAITAYVATMQYTAKIAATNTTTTPYLQISGIGTPASDAVIKKLDSSKSEIAVEASDMLANGIYKFQRNSANTAWILLNPEKNPSSTINKLVLSTISTLTISSGIVTVTGSTHIIDTESAAASDDLDTINGGQDGQIIYVRSVADARNVVLKHNTGNIWNPWAKDITLDLTTDLVGMRYDSNSAKWIVISQHVRYDFLTSASTNGYAYLPSGIIIQWGVQSSVTSSGSTVTFPIAFPTACLRAVVSVHGSDNTASANICAGAAALTAANFLIANSGATETRDWQWIAIGH